VRANRSILLSGALAISMLAGSLVAVIVPPTASAAAARPHPVRPEVHRLPLAGVDQAALAELHRQEIGANPAVLTSRRPTEAFRLLGVSWTPAAPVPRMTVEARTRAAGSWSQMRQL
jgi:hypothetical protein